MRRVTALFHRDCLCEVVMLPLWSHLHGSYMMVLLLLLLVGIYSLDGHVMASMCVHVCSVFTVWHMRGGRS